MKFLSFLLFTTFCILFYNAKTQNIHTGKKIKAALAKVDKESIKNDISYLASDRLKGRFPGESGYQMAVDYVINQFRQIGLGPAGDNKTYLQKLVLRKATLNIGLSNALLKDNAGKEDSLVIGKDIFIIPNTLNRFIQAEAPLVFVGFGIDIPGKYSDYKGIDVKGKIVVFLNGTPEGLQLPATLVAHFGSTSSKMEVAASKGAVGVFIAPSDTTPLRGTAGTLTTAMNPEKTAVFGRATAGNLNVVARVSFALLKRLFVNSGINLGETLAALKKLTTASFQLPAAIKIQYSSTFKDVESYNVAGRIEGGDARLKNEYVVLTAHLDHLGIGKAVNGDSIYNGAHDNASGVASLLEIARTYKVLGSKPRRSILIVMVTGEEMGLLGSAYFAANPTVPASQIVADINADMPTLIAPLLSVAPLGAEHSSLLNNVVFACKQLNIEIQQDPMPGEHRFIRSDQYSFVLQGIPSLIIKYGSKTTDPSFNLVQFTIQWRDKNYHKPSDEITNSFDFDAARKFVQLNFLISYSIAQTTRRPKWNDGDFFDRGTALKK